MRLTSLATGGMSIIVATPYLDEAERCHRVALMERGKIYDIDTPAQLSLQDGSHTSGGQGSIPWRRPKDVLAASPEAADVQRFGDRLDVMAARPDAAEADLRQRAEANGLKISEIRPLAADTRKRLRRPVAKNARRSRRFLTFRTIASTSREGRGHRRKRPEQRSSDRFRR